MGDKRSGLKGPGKPGFSMDGLHLITDVSEISYLSLATWYTIGALFLFSFLHLRLTLPKAEEAAVALSNRYGAEGRGHVEAWSWRKDRDHPLVVIEGFALLGALLGLARAMDHATFDWYLRTGLALWPDYGASTPWIVNGVLAATLLAGAGLAVSACHRIHIFGLALFPFYFAAGATAFLFGFIGFPAAIVVFVLTWTLTIRTLFGLLRLMLRVLEPVLGVLLPSSVAHW